MEQVEASKAAPVAIHVQVKKYPVKKMNAIKIPAEK